MCEFRHGVLDSAADLTRHCRYRVHQKYNAPPSTNSATRKANETAQEFISVSQFGHTLLGIREKWADVQVNGTVEKQGLVLFAGDLFSPSVESSVTRG